MMPSLGQPASADQCVPQVHRYAPPSVIRGARIVPLPLPQHCLGIAGLCPSVGPVRWPLREEPVWLQSRVSWDGHVARPALVGNQTACAGRRPPMGVWKAQS